MSEKAHTPERWDVQFGHSDWGMPCSHVIVPEGEPGNDFDTWIAEVHSVTPYCAGASQKERDRAEKQRARARLIAAAPEMLEALEACKEMARVMEGLCACRGDDDWVWGIQAKIDAALSKATGGE